jgi:creatinine amidohydrolase/Fe(II)-dependent formamide hydrolase-like protein
MAQKNNEISLKGKMDDWGPFGEKEGKWLIFSIGNPEEGHGLALPRIMDDLFAQRVAHLISCKSGARYVAHIPWATDNFISVAKDWAPRVIPVKEIVENIKKFLKFHMDIFKEMDLPASKILIFSGHGGNNPLAEYVEEIKKDLNLEKLIIAPSEELADENMDRILKELEELSVKLATEKEDARKIKRTLIKILTGAGHASHMEHSSAAALGILDEKKLKIMNEELERDFDSAIQKWPPIGGLGGFLMAGGKYVEAIGTKDNDKYGLWNCFKTLRRLDGGKIKPVKELGDLVINLLVKYYSEIILNE